MHVPISCWFLLHTILVSSLSLFYCRSRFVLFMWLRVLYCCHQQWMRSVLCYSAMQSTLMNTNTGRKLKTQKEKTVLHPCDNVLCTSSHGKKYRYRLFRTAFKGCSEIVLFRILISWIVLIVLILHLQLLLLHTELKSKTIHNKFGLNSFSIHFMKMNELKLCGFYAWQCLLAAKVIHKIVAQFQTERVIRPNWIFSHIEYEVHGQAVSQFFKLLFSFSKDNDATTVLFNIQMRTY